MLHAARVKRVWVSCPINLYMKVIVIDDVSYSTQAHNDHLHMVAATLTC